MTDLVERPKPDIASHLRAMADDLERNAHKTFGGLVIVMPPQGSPISYMVHDEEADLAAFWQGVDFRVKKRLGELDDTRRNQQAFGGLR